MLSDLFLRAVRLKEIPPEEQSYIVSLPVVKALRRAETLEFTSPVTFLVGENGAGKSTLLEAIAVACGFNAEGGSRNFSFGTTLEASHSPLHRYLGISRGIRRPRDGYFLRAESFFNVATELERIQRDDPFKMAYHAYGDKSLHTQSHGESFLSLVLQRFGAHGLYLLDEPEAALSPQSQFAVLSGIHQLVENGSQLIIATHSPILMAYPGAQILSLDADTIRPVAYTETDHYLLTREFLNHPGRMLRELGITDNG